MSANNISTKDVFNVGTPPRDVEFEDDLYLYLAVSDSVVSSTLIKEEGRKQSLVYYTNKP